MLPDVLLQLMRHIQRSRNKRFYYRQTIERKERLSEGTFEIHSMKYNK